MNIFLKMADQVPFMKELSDSVQNKGYPVAVTGVSNIHKSHLAYALASHEPVCVVTDTETEAMRMVKDINALSGSGIAVLFPTKDYLFIHTDGASFEYEQMRLAALSAISQGRASVLVAPVDAVMQGTVPRSVLAEHTFTLRKGDTIDIAELSGRLIGSGYSKFSQVEGTAQFSRRGDIFDIYGVSMDEPVRLELWGDEIDKIYTFDPQSQRRTSEVQSCVVAPAREILFEGDCLKDKLCELSKKARGKLTEKIRQSIESDTELLSAGISLTDLDRYYNLAYSTRTTVFDYFEDSQIVVCERESVLSRAKAFVSSLTEDLKVLYEQGIMTKSLDGFYLTTAEMTKLFADSKTIYLDTFMRGGRVELKALINASCYQTSAWSGDFKSLVSELKAFCGRDYTTVLYGGSEKTLDILISDLRESDIPCERLKDDSELVKGFVYVTAGSVSNGFDYADARLALLTRLQSESSRKRKGRYKAGEKINSLSDINVGDLVVHSLYGIGRFQGIKKLENCGVLKDYITISYAGSDVLYVPVTQLDLITGYVGSGDDKVKLNKLNSGEWKKTKSRVKAAAEDMAKELTALYAKRQLSKGYAFSPDSEWQRDFEERFDYTETDDQLRSISEIKSDMEKSYPMDRLLCGDVGFGKTEVAFRACMKCMLDSKQCAILVPTTVLAWQHYQTAVKRFEHFPVRIELLSRFRTPTEQKKVIRDLKSGLVDMVIGTHRLVQKDIEFKDLGLAVIDEEQRFGVKHKEKFKEMFPSVDILTLSATPIPRTLNMAMSGIRDMSTIDDPPQDRLPVQTYVIEHNEAVIVNAIERELRRGGQVYYIHNRVETINHTAAKLSSLVDARIEVAHGQMSESELSDVWRKLVDKEIDVLVCTTIIETGVDVSNVNTLIIENADRFGLAQLYQLRGRVGRSSRRAFAYFTFTRGKELSEIASKRLQAIREFTQFGSGFKIAMRDLELRGAGSILSSRQSGHMEAVGYEMYLRILNEAIAEQKGEALPTSSEDCMVDITINAYIPDSYIESLTQRIDAYRKIAAIYNEEDANDVIDELCDRYGKIPRSVDGLIEVSLLRNRASQLKISEIAQRGKNINFYIKDILSEQITSLAKAYKRRIKFVDEAKPYFAVAIDGGQKPVEIVRQTLEIMEKATE
ncbi:MAG: transcription-repair coupling factor [Ruminococcus sp.]|nr:transcription-repair coupling factor [Ruminococcus sp.]